MRVLVLAALTALLIPLSTGEQDGGNLVNAVLGNRTTTRPHFDEKTRIRAHLLTVAERLAASDVAGLTPELRVARARNIRRLVAYARTGRFPHKPASMPGRTPNFVDDGGAVCAVGYLIEQDLGRAAVEEIARVHQFDYVPYIDSPLLASWQSTSGLTALELAMIQPQYGGGNELDDDSGVSGEDVLIISLVTADVVSSIFNFTYLAQKEGNPVWGAVGVLVGAFSIIHDQDKSNPTDYLTAAGAMAAAFGAVSLGFSFGGEDGQRVEVTPLAPGTGEGVIGLQARLCF